MELRSSFKLSLIFLLVATPASIALAQPSDCPICSFNGFSVGLGLGATTYMTRTSSETTVQGDSPTFIVLGSVIPAGNAFTNDASNRSYRYDAMGALFAGYGMAFDNHSYLGADLGINVFNANNTTLKESSSDNLSVSFNDALIGNGQATYHNTLATKTKVTRNAVEPFLDLKLGFLMTPNSLVYIRGGLNYNTIKIKTTGNYLSDASSSASVEEDGNPFTTSSTASTSSAFSDSKKHNQLGYRAGVGMEIMLTPVLGVGADYVYTFYRTIKTNGTRNGNDISCDIVEGCQTVGAVITNSSKATVNDQQIMAQLIYHLG